MAIGPSTYYNEFMADYARNADPLLNIERIGDFTDYVFFNRKLHLP